MTKIVIAGFEFLLLEQPISSLAALYGVSNRLVTLMSKRFEMYKQSNLQNNNIHFFFEQLCEFLPAPYSFKYLYAYNITYLEYINSYQTYRHLFNLPVNGQRTWGGGRSSKILKSQLYQYKLKKLGHYFKCSQSIFMAEVVNLLWKQQ